MAAARGRPTASWRAGSNQPRRNCSNIAAMKRTPFPKSRHHICGLRQCGGRRAADPLRHHPPHHVGPGMGASFARPGAAGASAQPLPQGHLRCAGNFARRIVPPELIYPNPHYRPQMNGLSLSGGIYVQVAGIDVVRVDDKDFYVLEDNLRTPSGCPTCWRIAKYVAAVSRSHGDQRIRPIENYVDELLGTLKSVAPERSRLGSDRRSASRRAPTTAPITSTVSGRPHGRRAGRRRDLVVRDEIVYMRTTEGPKRVDVIYSRVETTFSTPRLPARFRPRRARTDRRLWAGNVTIANAPGTGVADDKAM